MPSRDTHEHIDYRRLAAAVVQAGRRSRDARPTGVRTRLRAVLSRYASDIDDIHFMGDDGLTTISLPITAWREMGRPEQITVSIGPGDQLST